MSLALLSCVPGWRAWGCTSAERAAAPERSRLIQCCAVARERTVPPSARARRSASRTCEALRLRRLEHRAVDRVLGRVGHARQQQGDRREQHRSQLRRHAEQAHQQRCNPGYGDDQRGECHRQHEERPAIAPARKQREEQRLCRPGNGARPRAAARTRSASGSACTRAWPRRWRPREHCRRSRPGPPGPRRLASWRARRGRRTSSPRTSSTHQPGMDDAQAQQRVALRPLEAVDQQRLAAA